MPAGTSTNRSGPGTTLLLFFNDWYIMENKILPLIYITIFAAMSVTWTKSADNKFEVATKEHLLQIMNQGALYTDSGVSPTNYWGSNYVQTSDIDLADDHASILPIGNSATAFTGEYDGGLFEIKNWSFASSTELYQGLFGNASSATLQSIRLSGVWTLSGLPSGSASATGFLCGYMYNGSVDDVEGDFAEGTIMTSTADNRGALFGSVANCDIDRVTLRGSMHFDSSSTGDCGGMMGMITYNATATNWRNLATFSNGLSGENVGGICGNFDGYGVTASNWLNAMSGDINGQCSGGIIGYIRYGGSLESLVNSMTGDITSTSQYAAGGVVGYILSSNTFDGQRWLNYMKGDITAPTGGGGIIGFFTRDDRTRDLPLLASIVAMHGSVEQCFRGHDEFTPSVVEVFVDTSFGMTYTGNEFGYGSATMVADSAFVYHADFTDLPYIDIGGLYAWDFIFANVGGKAEFDEYTHLSLHTSEVSTPFRTDFGLAEGNTTVYLTYANTDDNSLYIDAALTISETTADVAYDHAKSTVMYSTPDAPETLAWTKNDDGKFEVATAQHLLQIMNQGTMFTDLGDYPSNYYDDANDIYHVPEELRDISKVGFEVPASIVNVIFATGDIVEVDMAFERETTMKTTFLKNGDSLEIEDVNALLLPFDLNTSETQESSMTLSDDTVVMVSVAQESSEISIGGETYESGVSFVIDGKKCTAYDI